MKRDLELIELSNFKVPDGKRDFFIFDTIKSGLVLRVFESGKATYIFQKWENNRTKRKVIGCYTKITAKAARLKADELDRLNTGNEVIKNESGMITVNHEFIMGLVDRISELEKYVYGEQEDIF